MIGTRTQNTLHEFVQNLKWALTFLTSQDMRYDAQYELDVKLQ